MCAHCPDTAERQSTFEQAVACALHLWPALTLAVQNGWGGPDSIDKRDWFAGAVVDLFPEFTDRPPKDNKAPVEPELEDFEAVLLQVMMDEFEVNVDDDSGAEVARQIMGVRCQCAIGQFDEANALRQRFGKLKGNKVDHMFKRAEDADQDTNWETDGSQDDDSDVDDDEDGGADVPMAKALHSLEKPAPQVDQDGFVMVTKKKR